MNRQFLDIDWSVIKIQGEQSQYFLQGQLTCDVSLVNEQRSCLAAYCNHQGRVLAVLLLTKKEDDYFCFMPSCISQHFISTLSKYAVFSKVSVLDVSKEYFIAGLINEGPKIELFETAQIENLAFILLPGNICLVWGPPDKHRSIQNSDLWKQALIAAKLPLIYEQTIASVTPHMLNLPELGAVSFNKGCYVGQEIIARTHYLGKSKRHLYATHLKGMAEIMPGQPVFVQGQEVGIVIDAVPSTESTAVLAVLQDCALDQIHI